MSMTGMGAWLQLVLTVAAVAGVVLGTVRWGMRGFESRVGAVVRAETAPQFAQIDARFAQVDAQFVEVRHQFDLVNQRLGSLEGDMVIVKQWMTQAGQRPYTERLLGIVWGRRHPVVDLSGGWADERWRLEWPGLGHAHGLLD